MGKKSLLAKRIYRYLKTLKKGEVTTYKALAERFGTSARAVGRILAANRDSRVPCYKVIKSNGALGGYNGLLGKSKKELLETEGFRGFVGRCRGKQIRIRR